MRFDEFATTAATKPKTPDQARIESLKQAKNRASDALKTERNRQKLQKVQTQLAQVRQPSVQ